MAIAERKIKQRADREAQIVAAARSIAENEGWSAVTIRRLAEEIDYSQPVLYSHFTNREAIVSAVAVEGFREITRVLAKAGRQSPDRRKSLENAGTAYLAFARAQPALYEAMFTLPTNLAFAGAMPELTAAFKTLSDVVKPAHAELEVATETFWAALHGLAQLERSGRIRRSARAARLGILVDGMLAS